jgi:hypothetical protein
MKALAKITLPKPKVDSRKDIETINDAASNKYSKEEDALNQNFKILMDEILEQAKKIEALEKVVKQLG